MYVANEKNCALPGAVRRVGNLPLGLNAGVHAADDVVLTAMGLGAEMFHGHIEHTRVFRGMVTRWVSGRRSEARSCRPIGCHLEEVKLVGGRGRTPNCRQSAWY